MHRGFLAALVVCVVSGAWSGRATEKDEQPGLFRERCGACHEGAGVLAKQSLVVVDGVLFGKDSGRDIRDFLPGHFGRLTEPQLGAVYSALLRVVRDGGRFEARCAICHREATALAREKLILVDGQLRGRYTGRDIGAFLTGHGTRNPEEAAFFEGVLRRFTTSSQ